MRRQRTPPMRQLRQPTTAVDNPRRHATQLGMTTPAPEGGPGRVVVFGDPGEIDDGCFDGDPHKAEMIRHAVGRLTVRTRGDGQRRGLHRYLHTAPVGSEAVPVVCAFEGSVDHTAGRQWREAVGAAVRQSGQLSVQPDDAPMLSEEFHRHGRFADVVASGDGVPAATQRRVLVREPAVVAGRWTHGSIVAGRLRDC